MQMIGLTINVIKPNKHQISKGSFNKSLFMELFRSFQLQTFTTLSISCHTCFFTYMEEMFISVLYKWTY